MSRGFLFGELPGKYPLVGEMATCIESGAGKRLALDLSNSAFQVSINARELDAEARRMRQIADELI